LWVFFALLFSIYYSIYIYFHNDIINIAILYEQRLIKRAIDFHWYVLFDIRNLKYVGGVQLSIMLIINDFCVVIVGFISRRFVKLFKDN
jgi:hypothetical protein